SSESGASGAIWRNTLRFPLRLSDTLTATPRVGLDKGWIRNVRGEPLTSFSGVSAGVDLAWKNLTVDIDYQRGLTASPSLQRDAGYWLVRTAIRI
ncbi:ShlB/FhaC/HecB family hemolysin secretion/activation protein, partial [Ralstonia pseudosolanacearum]|uniref:ShlB/FhaC/HecB family hemolysin secretion/activation protein n=1 Tax=Ralstonia pseudosolanacearum TaxID=1310165 RepID=UPI003D2D29EE